MCKPSLSRQIQNIAARHIVIRCLLQTQHDLDCKHSQTEVSLRSNRPEVFLGKGLLKICSKFTGEQPCRSVISIKLQGNFIEITLRHGCSPVSLLHIFRTPITKNISGQLLLFVSLKLIK